MKREGRQHGMVRAYRILPAPWDPRPGTRFVQRFDSPSTARLFTKVPAKPTNHSKFTGRCGRARCVGCHMHPACKSKDKIKGTQKLRSNHDMVTNYKLITWRLVDGRPGLKFSGFSASRILDHLSSHDYEDYAEHDDHVYEHDDDDGDDDVDQCGLVNYGFTLNSQPPEEMEDSGEIQENNIIVDNSEDHGDDHDDDKSECVYVDEDDMKFVLDQDLEDEGWCLVGDI